LRHSAFACACKTDAAIFARRHFHDGGQPRIAGIRPLFIHAAFTTGGNCNKNFKQGARRHGPEGASKNLETRPDPHRLRAVPSR